MKQVQCYTKNYPRPQFVRKSFIPLDGEWRFAFDEQGEGERQGWYASGDFPLVIRVPFAYQTPLSGVNTEKHCENIWYARTFTQEQIKDERLLLHFEGCDYICKVWLNGTFLGSHKGGYSRFTFDVTNFLQAENLLVVKCEDSYSRLQPRGKQRWQDRNEGCWYTDTSGIWKTVWMESVGSSYLEDVFQRVDFDRDRVTFAYYVEGFCEGLSLSVKVHSEGRPIAEVRQRLLKSEGELTVNFVSPVSHFCLDHWTCDRPALYDLTYELLLGDRVIDRVGSYTGFYKYATSGSNILMNYSPLYLKMVLAQGYYAEGGLTPPDEQSLIDDILLIKSMGFNGVRMHQKIEDERFYYYCDLLGLLVWCEMPSFYEYYGRSVKDMTEQWTDIVRQHVNHPSIMAWVPFNESWGIRHISKVEREQNLTLGIYYLTKALDSTRFVISNDGWEHTKSDLITLHNYTQEGGVLRKTYHDIENFLSGDGNLGCAPRMTFADGFHYAGQPVVISEYGGVAFRKDAEKGWGYGSIETEQEFLARLQDITGAIRALSNVSGYCLTQLTDVMQEVNGLTDMERHPKAPPDSIRRINQP